MLPLSVSFVLRSYIWSPLMRINCGLLVMVEDKGASLFKIKVLKGVLWSDATEELSVLLRMDCAVFVKEVCKC